jgi:type II secretory pathway pseudopilin PulG
MDETTTIEGENYRKTIIDILLGVVLISAFIATFFFTFVSNVEKEVVETQMQKIVKDLTANIKLYTLNANTNVLSLIKNEVAGLQPPDLSAQDKTVNDHNNAIKKKAGIAFGIIIITGILIILTQIKYIKTDLLTIVVSNIIILGLVAVTEYIFVSRVSRNYQIIDGNYVRYQLLTSLQNYSRS